MKSKAQKKKGKARLAIEEDALLSSAIAAAAEEKSSLEAQFADVISSLSLCQRRCPDGHGMTAGICNAGDVCSTCLADTSLEPGVACSAKRCDFIACANCLLGKHDAQMFGRPTEETSEDSQCVICLE